VSTLAISHGSLTITVASTQAVSQPGLGARVGQTAVTRSTNATANEAKASFGVIAGPEDSAVKPTIQDVANALNALGLTTRDMMAIFQTMKRAGALQAELILN
jgi:flagellar P-ring protein precursor FlgI